MHQAVKDDIVAVIKLEDVDNSPVTFNAVNTSLDIIKITAH